MNELNDFIQTATPADIRETLDFLFNECSLDESPTAEQVIEWQTILQQRGGKYQHIAQTLCADFLRDINHE